MPPRNNSLSSDAAAGEEDADAVADQASGGDARAGGDPQVHAAKRQLDALRAEVARGLESLARGDYVEVDERDLRTFLDGLAGVSAAGRPSAR